MRDDWVTMASKVFNVTKPDHFTDFRHCDECEEHDQTLLKADLDTIGITELGNPGWDPICFSTALGKMYYLPALIRLTLQTMNSDFYLEQLLFHLSSGGDDDQFYQNCSIEQKQFVASFIQYLIENYPDKIEGNACTWKILNCHEIWSQ